MLQRPSCSNDSGRGSHSNSCRRQNLPPCCGVSFVIKYCRTESTLISAPLGVWSKIDRWACWVLGGMRKSSETNTRTGTCLRRYISVFIIKAHSLLSGPLTSHNDGHVMEPPLLIISNIKGILYYENSLYKNFPKQSNSSICFIF